MVSATVCSKITNRSWPWFSRNILHTVSARRTRHRAIQLPHYTIFRCVLSLVIRLRSQRTHGMAGARVRSPGRAHCQLNFPRNEQVVQVQVLDKVKAARQEVQEQYGDMMGVRGPQWTSSSFVHDSKYTTGASDEHLANQLLLGSICRSDVRHTQHSASSKQRYDTQHYYAFTRGEATTGWNHSTELPSRLQWARQQQSADMKALAATARHRQHLTRYQSPPEREEAYAASLRQQKQAVVSLKAALQQQYGPEGAAAMQQILAMKKPDRQPVRIKTTKDDVMAVLALPAAGLADDS